MEITKEIQKNTSVKKKKEKEKEKKVQLMDLKELKFNLLEQRLKLKLMVLARKRDSGKYKKCKIMPDKLRNKEPNRCSKPIKEERRSLCWSRR